MKKRVLGLVMIFAVTVLLSGCATLYPVGSMYVNMKLPGNMGDGKDVTYTKIGKSQGFSLFSMIAMGDASLEKAIKNGGLKTVKYADYHVSNFLGIYGSYTTTAYGE